MRLWVVSDLHLADGTVAPMFDEARQGDALARLCDRIEQEGGELVLLGDVFDLTAMTPPRRGLASFGRSVSVPMAERAVRSTRDLCAATRARHERTIAAIARLSRSNPVTLVPGNHDHALGGDDGRGALDAIGLERVGIASEVRRTIADRTIVLRHGHELDDDNAAPGRHGEVLTQVMHQAIVPFLEAARPRPNVRVDPARLVALRPEERMVPVLERWLPPKTFDALVAGLLELLVDLGALSRVERWLATPEKVRERLDDADDLWERTSARAREQLGEDRAPSADVLVLGHTHVPDWAVVERSGGDGLYVNLGSWTDRATDAVGPFDRTLPLLRVDGATRGLRAVLEDLVDGAVLASFDGSHGPPGEP